MIGEKTVLAIIPARGGSKGVPRKNIRQVAGKPLIAWTIEEAKKSKYIDRLILSSEDAEIIDIARKWGCDVPFVRPAELSLDDTPGTEPIIHAIESLPGYDYAVVLQPTSPLRTAEDIDGIIEHCFEQDADLCVSVCKVEENPWWMLVLGKDGRLAPLMADYRDIPRRQDLPAVYIYNGATYIAKCEWLICHRSFTLNPLAYEMPSERSLDIDTEMDIRLFELMKNI